MEAAGLRASGGRSDDPLAHRQAEIAERDRKPVLILFVRASPDKIPEVIAEVQRRLEMNRDRPSISSTTIILMGRRYPASKNSSLEKTGYEVFPPQAGEKYHKFRFRVSDGVLLFRLESSGGLVHVAD